MSGCSPTIPLASIASRTVALSGNSTSSSVWQDESA